MKVSRLNRPIRTDIWREGVWIDLWSIVHFLSGASVGFVLYLFNLGNASALVIAFLLFVSYEMWEAIVKIEETLTNRLMDVVVGMLSFVPIFFFLAPSIPHIQVLGGLIFTLLLDAILSSFGWMASRKAATLEEKMRLEYRQQRHAIQVRLAHRRLRMKNKKKILKE
jgi:hypothetical protein